MYYIWYIYFGYFRHSAAHLFVHILLMLQKFCIFFGTLPEHWGYFFFRYSRHSQDMYYFDIFILDIWDIKHLIYLCMFQKFCIFLGHLPERQDCFFSDILDTHRICVTFDMFISHISDIQQLIYLCTFS